MIFKFIRYTQPAWQFNLTPASNEFPSCYATENDLNNYKLDERFSSQQAALADAGYFLWNSGHLLKSSKVEIEQQKLIVPTLKDEYTFIRKYWSAAWAMFALALRLVTFKNPFKEIAAFVSTRKVKRAYPHQHAKDYSVYENFLSPLVAANPKVAVIIPTLNRYHILQDVLKDLEQQ
ncbi:MAG TPA: hypothetical protein PL045_07630, partial [Chitinophagaceae bacterium]|nr:hypothetical protein [Chitinophagaceae bacterium]